MLITRLSKHVLGKLEMTPTQIKAAEILLKKAMPDLSAVEHSGEMTQRSVVELSEPDLERIAAGGSPGAAESSQSTKDDAGIH